MNNDALNCRLRPAPCGNCPFRRDGKGVKVQMAQYYQNLIDFGNHICHSDDTRKTICRGGREWQLNFLHSVAVIEAPTHKELISVMRASGVEPEAHILQGNNVD